MKRLVKINRSKDLNFLRTGVEEPTVRELDNDGVLRVARQHALDCHATWVVKPSATDCGCPLDWIAERSLTRLTSLGFVVIPRRGETIETLIQSKMLTA